MNESQVKMIIPPTLGILVAGVASGICYLLIGSLRKGKSSKSVSYDDSRCACCLKPFLIGRGVECNDCGARSCRKACCRWDSVENSWFCLFCYHSRTWAKRREKWFRSFGGLPVEPENCKNFSTAKSRVYDEGAEHVAIHTELDLAAGGREEGDSMETVREFVEKIVEGLVGNVDDTPIDRLYDHSAYDRFFEAYGTILASTLTRLAMSLRQCVDSKPATDTPTMAHTALRELVERAVDEARKLPRLGATVSTELHEDSNFSEQNYEDLLATAILNKVIEKFQNERVDGNSNVVHRRKRSKYTNHDNEIGLDEGVDEGSSSLEPLSQDECSSEGSGSRPRHTRVRKEPLSLTIEEQIEEVTMTYDSDEELGSSKTNVLDFRNSRRVPFPEFGMDIVDPSQDSSNDSEEETNDLAHVDVITPIESWEENWLFQRRRIQTQSEPVSMLVPNPSADYRALIGDRDAEDTSDLSEFSAQSDDEIDNDEFIETIVPRSLPKTKKIATTKNRYANEMILWESPKIDETTSSNDPTIEKIDENQDRHEFHDNEKFENIFSQKIVKKCDIDGKKNFHDDKCENNDSGLSKNSHDPVNSERKNFAIPKTPASSLLENLISADRPEVTECLDYRRLSEKLGIVDNAIDEETIERENLRNVNYDEKINDKISVERLLSSCDVNSTSSTTNGCLEAISQEQLEMKKNIDQRDSDVHRIRENSSNEKKKSNENGSIIEKPEMITNGSTNEGIDSQCQSLASAKVILNTEKTCSRYWTDDDIELATPPRPGTIAEREHKKWENAAPIENNPYSEENIQKRLLERQYARRSSSDVSGSSGKLQTSPSPPLQIILGAGRPDFKRFGRDYYINEAKSPNGRRIETGFYTATSRSNSSMSQTSTGSDYEHQERSRSIETESTCSTSSDSRIKLSADLGKKNSRVTPRRGSITADRRFEIREISNYDETMGSSSDLSQNYYDDNPECEGKNNNNEINARLKKRENFENNEKLIKRIDLRDYGFANEFKNDEYDNGRKKTKRVIKKLDLRTYGYDSGLRRTQSNNNIDDGAKIRLSQRERKNVRNFGLASSDTFAGSSERRFAENLINEALTKSTESLSLEIGEDMKNFHKINSARSATSIDKIFSKNCEFNGDNGENISDARFSSFARIETSRENEKNENFENYDGKNETNDEDIEIGEKSFMPSVRKLARAFSKNEKDVPVPARRLSKTVVNSSRERPTTPEIHIVDTPRQMHSLTARSISREFREGLRQITSKQTTGQTKKILIPNDNSRMGEFSTAPQRGDSGSEDAACLVGSGKLKSNIKFWEQMHRKS